jgi:hypothetical protein
MRQVRALRCGAGNEYRAVFVRRQKMLAKRALLICIEAVLVVGVIGCGAPKIISTDAGVFRNCTLYANSGSNLDSVYVATLQAMDKLQLKVTDKATKVTAKSADGKMVTVKIKPTEFMKTQYEIYVFPFGDQELSRKIFDQIIVALETPKVK